MINIKYVLFIEISIVYTRGHIIIIMVIIIMQFWHCPYVQTFWNDICDFIANNIYSDFVLFWIDVLFGLFRLENNNKNITFIINLIILIAKFHIHKCKFTRKKTLILCSQWRAQTLHDLHQVFEKQKSN